MFIGVVNVTIAASECRGMRLTRAEDDDVETLVDFWYSLASSMEDYSKLNELAIGTREQAQTGVKSWIQDEDVTILLIKVEE